MTLFAELVETSERVAATSSRTAKVAALADLLRRLEPDEVAPTVALLSGEARQGRIGVGWATLGRPRVVPGRGAVAHRRRRRRGHGPAGGDHRGGVGGRPDAVLAELFGRATEAEDWFLRLALTGGLRQGALEGVMLDAVAKASAPPGGGRAGGPPCWPAT